MKKRAVCLAAVFLAALALYGSQRTALSVSQHGKKKQTEDSGQPSAGKETRPAAEKAAEDGPESPEAFVFDAEEDAQYRPPLREALPADTMEYVESSMEEITETVRQEAKVDENDPSTYRVVSREVRTETQEELPSEYSDALGYVKYAWSGGTWKAYQYSSGEITLDEADEETALLLLEMFEDYEGYERISIQCSAVEDPSAGTRFSYHVMYRAETELEGEPEETEGLTVSATRTGTVVRTELVQEKVPVVVEKEVPTGEYRYFGWQEQDGDRFYYDKDGQKATGTQIIRGVRYEFLRDGRLNSRAGVDVSSASGTIDWRKVRDAGMEFALIRCGYRGAATGALTADSRCSEYVSGAKEAGLSVALCFYSQAVTEAEAEEEAAFLAEAARAYGTEAPLILMGGYTKALNGRADGLSPEDRTACVQAFCREARRLGFVPMLGGEKGWLGTSLDMEALGQELLWLAEENAGVSYDGAYEIWQYTASGTVDGIEGPAGKNIITGNGRVFQ